MISLLSVLLFFQLEETKLQREFHYKRWQHGQQGFVSDTIMTLAQDQLGFVWVGTPSGLQRFDGYRFESFPSLSNQALGSSSHQIKKLHADSHGFLWVGTFDRGLNRLDPRNFEVLQFVHEETDSATKGMNRISGMAEDSRGFLWVSTISGLRRLNLESLEIKNYLFEESSNQTPNANFLTSVFVDSHDTVWVASYAGLMKYEAEEDRFISVPLQRMEGREQKQLNVTEMVEDERGALLLATLGDGVIHLDQDLQSSHLVTWPGDDVFCLLKDDHDRFWRGLYNGGLQRVDPKTRAHDSPLNSPYDPYNLSNKSVTVLFEDQSKTLWIGTQRNGLYRFRPKTSAFNHFTIASPFEDQRAKTVYAVAPSRDGHFWISNQAGQVFYAQRDQTEKQYLPINPAAGPVQAMLEDRQGQLWLGYRYRGILRIDPKTQVKSAYKTNRQDSTSLSNNNVRDIVEDADGHLWIATMNGLNLYSPERNQFTRFLKGQAAGKGLQSSVVYALLVDQQNQLWLANDHSQVHIFNPARTHFKRLLISDRKGLDAFDFKVNALCEASDGTIFANVSGDGLKLIDPQNHTIRPLPNSPKFIMALMEDAQEHIWASTLDSGLYRITPTTGSMVHYGIDHGIQSLNFSAKAGAQLSSGELLFGGNNGFNLFKPQDVAIDSQPPTLFFEDILASGESILESPDDHHQRSKTLALPHWQNALTIKFLGLKVPNPEANRFEHQLEPLDQNWIPITPGQREIAFHNLGPGEYRFALRAANSDGVWNEQPKYLNFRINPPWWKTRTAIVSYILLGIFAVWLWIWWRTTSLRKRAVTLETQVELRTREIRAQKDTIESLLARQKILFANISHEFRTPLTLILGPLERLVRDAKKQNPLTLIRRNAQKLLRMVDQIMDLTRLANHEVVPSSNTFASQSLETLLDAFHSTLEERNLRLQRAIDANCWVDIHPDSFEKIVLNLLSNAIKYSDEGGEICVNLAARGDQIQLIVEDQGLGIPAEDLPHIFNRFYRSGTHQRQRIPGAGIGLALVKELTEMCGGSIQVASQDGEGTKFTLRFPASSPVSDTPAEPERLAPDSHVDLELSTLNEAPALDPAPAQSNNSRNASVLIIEDHSGMRDYIQSELAGSYQCHTAEDGVRGFEAAKSLIPDLILSDVMMPGMDGFELTHALKTESTTSHIPVILITARGDQDSRTSGIRQGADAYLIKPFNSQELHYRIENLLEVREILKKRFAAEFHTQNEPPVDGDNLQNPLDAAFLEKFTQLLDERYQDADFNLKDMVKAMAMSERPLQRKLKALTDHTPAQFLRNYRLKRAAELLRAGKRSSEVAFEIGFSSHAYFSACFKAHFSISPSAYTKKFVNPPA